MLGKLVDEILGVIGAIFGFIFFALLLAVAFAHYPIITSLLLGIGLLAMIVSEFNLSDEQAGVLIAVALVIGGIVALFYYDYKLAIVVLSAFTIGSLIDQRKKIKMLIQSFITHLKKGFNHALNKQKAAK